MNKIAGKKLAEARSKRNFTQQQLAQKLSTSLGQTYSHRQYQKLEEGKFPKYKKDVVKQIDKILGTNLFESIYEQKVPHETAQNSNSEEGGNEKPDNPTLLRILDNLSAAHREVAESNNKLADNGKTILEKIPNSSFDPERLIDVEATVLGIREFVGNLYASVNKTSLEEALAQLGTYSVAARRKLGKKGSVSDESKSHKTG
jgi:transcriptional regulator with XRE-family HTH domain